MSKAKSYEDKKGKVMRDIYTGVLAGIAAKRHGVPITVVRKWVSEAKIR